MFGWQKHDKTDWLVNTCAGMSKPSETGWTSVEPNTLGGCGFCSTFPSLLKLVTLTPSSHPLPLPAAETASAWVTWVRFAHVTDECFLADGDLGGVHV